MKQMTDITYSSLFSRRAVVDCKGKRRVIMLPQKLCMRLKTYCRDKGIGGGSVFVTRSGKPMDRSNIWKSMKKLCGSAGVSPPKVFPHNLRHLFARIFYELEKDIARLADILGHSSIETTRVYIITSGNEHERIIERMGLVV